MADMDLNALAGVLKRYYPYSKILNQGALANKFFAMVRKNTSNQGEAYTVPIQYATGANGSFTFSAAQTGPGGAKTQKFVGTGKTHYGVVQLPGDSIAACQGDAGKIVDFLKWNTDSKMKGLTNELGGLCFGSSNGVKAVASSYTYDSTYILTFADPLDALKFSQGELVQAATTATGTLAAGYGYVIAIDASAGTVQIGSAASTPGNPSGWTASHLYIFTTGNQGAAWEGLSGWIPATAPAVGGGDSFLGLDRALYGPALYGQRRTVAAGTACREASVSAASFMIAVGANPDVMFCNPMDYAKFENQLGDHVRYGEAGSLDKELTVPMRGIKIATPNGTDITVLGDRNCPAGTAYLLQMDTWEFLSQGSAPRPDTLFNGGNFLQRRDSSDAVEARYVTRLGGLTCLAPGWNCRLTGFAT